MFKAQIKDTPTIPKTAICGKIRGLGQLEKKG